MAVYKVIQDIEAEDKLVGYLGIRQFVYVIIAAASAFVCVRMFIAPDLGPIRWFVVFIFFGPMLVFGILAAPIGKDQPTEVWILSRLRYYLKTRKRVWNQSGIKNLVTITAPKVVQKQYTDGLSQIEVHSRLSALASTLDSRGWAVKNVNVNLSTQSAITTGNDSDRLTAVVTLPEDDVAADIRAEDDILDPMHNSTAQHFDRLMRETGQEIKQQAANTRPMPPKQDFYFMHENTVQQPQKKKHGLPKIGVGAAADTATFVATKVVQPGTDDVAEAQSDNDAQSKAILEKIHREKLRENEIVGHSHLKRIPTAAERREQEMAEQATKAKAQAELTASQQAAIVELAKNDEYRVSTVGQQANRITKKDIPNEDNEVIIQLH